MDLIEYWKYPELTDQTINTSEQNTALELASFTALKVNELITAFNNFSSDINPSVFLDVNYVNVLLLGVTNNNAESGSVLYDYLENYTGLKLGLYFPDGNYNFEDWTEPLTADYPIMIRGQSIENVKIKGLAANTFFNCSKSIYIEGLTFDTWNHVFDFDTASAVESIIVRNCKFKNINGTCVRWHTPVLNAKCDYVNIENNMFDTVHSAPVDITCFFDRVEIIRNTILDVTHATQGLSGIYIGHNTLADQAYYKNIIIRGNYIDTITCSGAGVVNGIIAMGYEGIICGNVIKNINNSSGSDCEGIYSKIVRCSINDNICINAGKDQGAINIKGGLRAAGTSTYSKGYSVICSHNHIYCDEYTHVCSGISIQTEDVLCTENIIEGVNGDPIAVVSVYEKSNITISKNIIRNVVGTKGIYIYVPVHDLIIDSNTIDGVRPTAGSGATAIRLSNDTAWDGINVKIINNIMGNLFNGAAETGNYIYFANNLTGGKHKNIHIAGNHLGAGARAFYFSGASAYENIIIESNFIGAMSSSYLTATTPVNMLIRDNIGYLTEGRGNATIPSGATSVVVTHGLGETLAKENVIVSRLNNGGNSTKFWISASNSSSFTISVDQDPGATTATFNWFGTTTKRY